MKKYCIFLILLSVYVCSSVGIFSSMYLEAHRNSFQATVTQGVPDNIERLLFSKEEFSKINWKEEFREFEQSGKLFDVSKIVRTKDGFVIYCVNDSQEESIIGLFKEWKKSNLPATKTKIQLQPLFCSNLFVEMELLDRIEQLVFSRQPGNYHSEAVQIPSPPPR